MPLPAGTGLTRRTFVSRTAGLALAVYGGGALELVRVRRRHRARRVRGAATQKVLVSVFLAGGIDAPQRALPGRRPGVLRAAAEPRARARRPGPPFTEDSRLRWHPAAASIATLHGEGKVSVIPAIGYANSDKSHFTSRHYWEVGATGRDAPHRLARPLPRQGRHRATTRCRGSRSTSRCSRRSRRRRCRSRRSRRPTSTRSPPPGVAPHPLESSILQEAANIGAAHTKSTDAGLSTGRLDRARRRTTSTTELGAFAYGFKSPVAYPASTDPFPHRLAGLAAMIAAGLPMRGRDDHLAGPFRHARRRRRRRSRAASS